MVHAASYSFHLLSTHTQLTLPSGSSYLLHALFYLNLPTFKTSGIRHYIPFLLAYKLQILHINKASKQEVLNS